MDGLIWGLCALILTMEFVGTLLYLDWVEDRHRRGLTVPFFDAAWGRIHSGMAWVMRR